MNSELIWHYTTAGAAEKILDTGVIWASHCQYLNDKREFIEAIEAIKSAVSRQWTERNNPYAVDRDFLASFLSGMARFHQAYLASFSFRDDDLSQWRGYSGGGVPVAIGFDRQDVERRSSRKGFKCGACVYKAETFSELQALVQKLAAGEPGSGTHVAKHGDPRSTTIMKNAAEYQLQIYPYASELNSVIARLKHPKFSDEREFRVFRWDVDPVASEPEVFFREASGYLIPYLKLSLWDPGETSLPVRCIRVGPHPNAALNMRAFELIRDRRFAGLEVPVAVIESAVPYRSRE